MQTGMSLKSTCAGLLVLALVAGLGATAGAQQKPPSLYKRLGGYDSIAAVVDEFLGRMLADKQLSRFFTGASTDSKNRIRQLVVDQICAATGGPCVYIGRSMRAAHDGLNITENDWQAAVGHLVATLDKFGVPQKEKDELIGAVATLKPDIVIPPPAKKM
jgi:hemoglobin